MGDEGYENWKCPKCTDGKIPDGLIACKTRVPIDSSKLFITKFQRMTDAQRKSIWLLNPLPHPLRPLRDAALRIVSNTTRTSILVARTDTPSNPTELPGLRACKY